MWPQPNKHGVYEKDQANSYAFEDSRIYLVIHCLKIESHVWVFSFSYSKKIECKSGTMGVGSPLMRVNEISRKRGERDCISEQECLDRARLQVKKMVSTGLERGAPSWRPTYTKIDKWVSELGKQYDLFAS